MNRITKFRGKRIDNEKWLYGDLIENQGRFFIYHATSESTVEDNDDGRIVVVAVEVDPDTIGQFTGLRDDMGVEIFEGDILRVLNIRKSIYEQKDEYVYGSVLFQQGEYLIKTKDRIAMLVGTVADNLCEVFGNIHS